MTTPITRKKIPLNPRNKPIEWKPDAKKPWDVACKKSVTRHDYLDKSEVIDKGVNFFVLALEDMGARPWYSCEGHPDGFYIVFEADETMARRVESCGFFDVEVCSFGPWNPQKAGWCIRLPRRPRPFYKGDKSLTTLIRERNRTLRRVAAAWMREFYPDIK